MLTIADVTLRFDSDKIAITALDGVNLTVEQGEFVTLVGPSGCGKSSLLALIAGLTSPSEGQIKLNGQPVTGTNRDVGFITQQDNLFAWRTVIDNVALPLELAGVPAASRRKEAASWMRRVGLQGFELAYPHQLSGGMRQRANIIRTLIYEPAIILMDEPFGPLDAQTRLSLQALLLSMWETQRSTVLFVTHDLSEAIGLADRVALMSARPGHIVRVDPVRISRPRDIFHMHDQPEFRGLFDGLWQDLAKQIGDTEFHA
jgi:NitT/TauT family transport system ATP-binding protein